MNSNTFPIFTTERLMLRQLNIDDKDDIFALRSDPRVNKFIDRQPCLTNEDAVIFINNVNSAIKNNESYYWAITLINSKNVVGTICLFDFSIEKKSCEIGFELLPEFQGQGIMREAVGSVIDYVFKTLDFKIILAITHCENLNSIRLLEKIGFIKSITKNKENSELDLYSLMRLNN